jgi:peptidoglycan/LPS O-acetylase OafA/YrhL
VLSCAASSLALLAVFLRFANGRRRLLDSLRDNAYGIFVLHYPVVSWLQYVLLPAPLPGIVKGALVFLAALAVSWGAVALLRRLAARPMRAAVPAAAVRQGGRPVAVPGSSN